MTRLEQAMVEVEDLARFAGEEACQRILDIAAVIPEKQLQLIIGMKAARTLYIAFMINAVQDGMPSCAAEAYVNDTIDKINSLIEEMIEDRKNKKAGN